MKKEKKENKKLILCDDPVQREKNINEFVEKFKKEHKELFDRLADEWEEEK